MASKSNDKLDALRAKAFDSFGRRDLTGALAACQRYLKQDGRHANIIALLGIIRFEQGFHAAAIDLMRRACQLAPNDVGLRFNYAKMQTDLGQAAEAEPMLRACLTAKPDFDPAANLLGVALLALGRPAEAATSFRAASQLKPNNYEYFANLAVALRQLHALGPSVAALAKACELAPADVALQAELGKAYYTARDPEAALRHFDIATTLDPLNMAARSGAMLTRLRICDWSMIDGDRAFILNTLMRAREGKATGISPYVTTLISNDPSHCMAAARIASGVRVGPVSSSPNLRTPSAAKDRDVINVAYVSADYREHATSYLIAETIELHDRSRVRVFGLSYGPPEQSPMRTRMEAAFDEFVDVADLSPRLIAEKMRSLGIDVAVDLQGFNQYNRMEIFSHRAVPLQAIYLGWPGTSGTNYYDYIIADADVIPDENRQHFSESVVWLPCCYQPNDRMRRISDTVPSRAECGLPETALVFACLNNPFKILPEMFASWMRILDRVPGSVLWLLDDSPFMQANLRREAVARGIASDRIHFAKFVPNPEHLARLTHIDLVLDTLPYNAHTTASDALWMGVPVLTCTGTSFAGRVATSLLRGCGGSELITATLSEYETRAVELANDRERLVAIGRMIKQAARSGSPPFDTLRLARGLEAAYVAMADRQRQGKPPSHLDLRAAADELRR